MDMFYYPPILLPFLAVWVPCGILCWVSFQKMRIKLQTESNIDILYAKRKNWQSRSQLLWEIYAKEFGKTHVYWLNVITSWMGFLLIFFYGILHIFISFLIPASR